MLLLTDLLGGSAALSDDESTLYISRDTQELLAVNASNGAIKWTYTADGDFSTSPAIGADGTIYAGNKDTYMYAINPDGTLKWKYKTGSSIHSSPAVDSNGVIYFGSWDFLVYALDPAGNPVWAKDTGLPVVNSPALGTNGMLFIGVSNSLYAFGS